MFKHREHWPVDGRLGILSTTGLAVNGPLPLQVHPTALSSLIKLNHHVYLSSETHRPRLLTTTSLGPPRTGWAFLPILCSNGSISFHPFSLLCNSTSKSHLSLRVPMLCYLCSGHTGFHTDDSMLPQTPELLQILFPVTRPLASPLFLRECCLIAESQSFPSVFSLQPEFLLSAVTIASVMIDTHRHRVILWFPCPALCFVSFQSRKDELIHWMLR